MTVIRLASALVLLALTGYASAQPAPKKATDVEVAKAKEAAELLAPMFAANGVKDGYTFQQGRSGGIFADKGKFYNSFEPALRHAMDREKKGAGNDWKVELARREKLAQEKFQRNLWEIGVVLMTYKETRDALLLTDEDIIKLIKAMEELPRRNRDRAALQRLRQGPLKTEKPLPDAIPLPK